MDPTILLQIGLGVILLIVALKIVKSLVSKIIAIALSAYMILGESFDFPNIIEVLEDIWNGIF